MKANQRQHRLFAVHSSDEPSLPIGVVARRTGLTPGLIRAWERRYGVIEPERSESGRRLYSEKEVVRLRLLREVTEAGNRISEVVHLSNAGLRELLDSSRPVTASSGGDATFHRDRLMEAVQSLDPRALKQGLDEASVDLTRPRLIGEVIMPVVRQIGSDWEEGKLKIVHEHVATAVIEVFLAQLQQLERQPGNAPLLVLGAPSGHRHGLGALLAAAIAFTEGWRTLYLGVDLPVEEFAVAARRRAARVVALSLVYPPSDLHLARELEKLVRLLPNNTWLVLGGRAAPVYESVAEDKNVQVVTEFNQFRKFLRNLQ